MTAPQETTPRPPQGRKRLPIDDTRPPRARELGEMLQKNCPPRAVLTLTEIASAVPTSVSTVSRAMRAANVPIWETVEGIAAQLYVHRDKIAEPENFPLREVWYATWLAAWTEQGGKPYDMPPPGRRSIPGLAVSTAARRTSSLELKLLVLIGVLGLLVLTLGMLLVGWAIAKLTKGAAPSGASLFLTVMGMNSIVLMLVSWWGRAIRGAFLPLVRAVLTNLFQKEDQDG
ncbi:hypothetical protein ACFYSF_22470 [Streptomyces canus]|uniref:hypothetical protein n=1 Tax=Streptomyces canus TaxID=58343 RepID=UPI0036C3493D